MAELTKKKSGWAWAVAGAGFGTQMIVTFCLAMFGISIALVAEDFGVAVTSLAICSSIFGVTYGGFGVVWGNLADRIGIRAELSIAGIGAGIWAIVFGLFASDVVSAAIIWGLTGAFCSGISTGVVPKVVTSWFSTQWRGKGFTLVSIGGAIAGMLVGILIPPVAGFGGWQMVFMVFGGTNVVLGILCLVLVRDTPESIGTVPFGADPETYVPVKPTKDMTPEERAEKKAEDRRKILIVLKHPMTWKLGVMLIVWQLCLTTVSTYLTAGIIAGGVSLEIAAFVSTLKTAGMFCSQLVCPSLTDKFGRKPVFLFLMIGDCILFVTLFLILGSANTIIIYVIGFLAGVFDAQAPVMQSSLGESFPKSLRGTGPGMVTTITLVGRFFGPILAAFAINTIGGGLTTFAFVWAAAMSLLCAIIGVFVIPKTGGKYGDPIADEVWE